MSKHTKNVRAAPRLLLDVVGVSLIVLSIIVVVGQIDGVGWTLPAEWGLTSLDGAVALKLYGIALILCGGPHRHGLLLIMVVLLTLGGANLLSHVVEGEYTLRAFFLPADAQPIRLLAAPMLPNMAFGLLLASVLLWPLSAPNTRFRRLLLALGYTIVLTLGMVPLLSRLLGMDAVEPWPGFENIAALAALGLVLAGGAGLAATLLAQRAKEQDRPVKWAPITLALASVVVSAVLYQALEAQQSRTLRQVTAADASSVGREINTHIGHQMWTLAQAVQRLQRDDDITLATWWQRNVAGYLEDGRYAAIAWLGPALEIRELVTSEQHAGDVHADRIRDALQRQNIRASLGEAGTPAQPRLLPGRGREYYLFSAVIASGRMTGALLVVADIGASLAGVLRPFVERGYLVRVMNGRRTVYQTPAEQPAAAVDYAEAITDIGPGWRLTVTPTPELVARFYNPLPETVLAVGIALGLFAAALLWTLQLLGRSHADLRDLNRSLEMKVQHRTAELVQAVREREHATANFAHAASHDSLTGLANRTLFSEILDHALATTRREGGLLAVMFLDLDNFKDVNDRLGHQVGDNLLKQVCDRILGVLRDADVLARQGGDEFLVLANHLPSPDAAAAVAGKILEELRSPFNLGEFEAHVLASIGISFFAVGPARYRNGLRTSEEADSATLVKQADAAMYQAKENGRNRYEFYSSKLQARVIERVELRNALSGALARDELEVYYQPRVELASGRVTGAEALVRWRDPEKGLVSTALFVGVAEETGLINELDQMVLQRVCDDLRDWEGVGAHLPVISVNFSARHFRNRRLLVNLRAHLEANPHFSSHLEMEFTERLLVNDREHQDALHDIRRLGVRIAIDDFGTGNSSFAYFRQFPIDIIKIDRSFIRELEHDTDAAMITQTIIDLARNFQLTVVAAGIETEGQRDRLREQGCHEGQGFLFGRPMTANQFLACWRRDGGGT